MGIKVPNKRNECSKFLTNTMLALLDLYSNQITNNYQYKLLLCRSVVSTIWLLKYAKSEARQTSRRDKSHWNGKRKQILSIDLLSSIEAYVGCVLSQYFCRFALFSSALDSANIYTRQNNQMKWNENDLLSMWNGRFQRAKKV